MPAAYYNEIDPYAAQWLRNLIAAGHIAPGDVDERSIEDVHPDDLRPYTQCHFFAGIGVWSLALRRAGWPDDRPVWTGSCPCQPFSTAGAGAGFDDPRHLWPHFAWLIRQRRPGEILGEQVASKDAEPWLDLVQTDLEAMDYAFGAVAFPSAGVGAPHIRDRTYWAGNANSERVWRDGRAVSGAEEPTRQKVRRQPDAAESSGAIGDMGNAGGQRLGERISLGGVSGRAPGAVPGQATQRAGIYLGGMANPDSSEREARHLLAGGPSESSEGRVDSLLHGCDIRRPGPVNGMWADADWLFCRDGRWRPVEPGTFPLANGAPSRVGRLRAYGNAINVEAATQFIGAYLEAIA
ncbi:DNA cytosine methyltransferase [Pseudomonas sp. HS-18]|uniref:DNA cytosine methyltransferase n=1 Tax=Pseudomonas sp. HS-18 TaxID=2879114 RepID=UPI001CF0C083|nr:DNA cytosine methyltransferase [Pseudomonas sp. HS-18]UCL84534.1 DNA cytosine methyltransferase [Pseudomonas sp. HS-18]